MFLRNFSKTIKPEKLRLPPWVVTLVLRGLMRDLYVPFRSSDERFLTQSPLFLLALASATLTIVLHVLFVLSLSLLGLPWGALPLHPGFRGKGAGSPLLLGLRASLYRPYQTRAQSRWETVRSSGTVRFYLAITTPHHLRCERLFFPALRSMTVFSISLVSFWFRATLSQSCRLLGRPLPVPLLRARQTLGITPYLLLMKNFAVSQVLKAGTWRKHTTFLLNSMRVLAHRSLENFHLGSVVPASALVSPLPVA